MQLREIVARLGGRLVGDGDLAIKGVNSLSSAGIGEIAFLSNPRYRRQLAETQASAVIVSEAVSAEIGALSAIVTDDPYLYYARLTQLLHPPKPVRAGIHPTAIVSSTAKITPSAEIGPGVVIGEETMIGENTVIGANSVIGEGCVISADCRLHARVTLYDHVRIGNRAILHSGVVIGADGFGFAESKGQWVKIPQIGSVIIGDDVEIGANTTIDAGAIEPTRIGNGVKIDNLVMIAHNVEIGEHTAIAACTGIAGSTTIGRYCRLGGSVGMAGHLSIADGTILMAAANVTKSITKPGIYSSCIPVMPQRQWLKNIAHLKRLDAMATALKQQTSEEEDE